MKQRHDIDGLRALAVLPVVAFHAGIRQVPGGFVGVDIFFVISGYLIGAIILDAVNRREFSYLGFYERRIRRIAPALLVMIAATALLGYFLLFPVEYRRLSLSALAAVGSVSNFYFWATADYFAPSTEEPLLHTWSLAVEEQFYILLPPLLVLAHRWFPGRVRWVVAGTLIGSLVASAVLVETAPMAAFYSPFTRTWELMLGVMLAAGLRLPSGRAVRELAAWSGVAMILAAVLLYTKRTPFPGLAALPPALGTALIIWAGEQGSTSVGRLLSVRPMVWIGLISYSLYLWHWPVMFFLRTTGLPFGEGQRAVFGLTAVVLSFVLAALSWRYVEQPFRIGHSSLNRRQVFRWAGVATGGLLGGFVLIALLQGLPGRFSPEAVRVASFLDTQFERPAVERRCFVKNTDQDRSFDEANCLASKPGQRNYVLLGDSYAEMLWSGLSAAYPEANVMIAGAAGCRPIMEHSAAESPGCVEVIDRIFAHLMQGPPVDGVILVARWRSLDVARLEATVQRLRTRGIPVTLVGPTVEYDAHLPRLLAMALERGDAALPARHLIRGQWKLDQVFADLAARTGSGYVSMVKLLCPQTCTEYVGERVPMLQDYGHLTPAGSVYVARFMRETLKLPAP